MGWDQVAEPRKPCDGSCGWHEYVETIDEMLEDEDYGYASAFLEEVSDWISDHKHVTVNQKRAINRIKSKRSGPGMANEDLCGGAFYEEFWKY